MELGEMIITLLDRTVVSAAIWNAPVLGKRFVITGQANKTESENLAVALNAPIENDLELIEIRVIAK